MIRIEAITINPYKKLLARPFTIEGGLFSEREGVIIEVMDSKGRTGRGEAAPLPGISVEPLKKSLHQLACLKRDWVGRSFPDSSKILCARLEKDLERDLFVPSVLFGFESALVSLAASVQGISVTEFLGGAPLRTVRSACLINGDLKTIREHAARYTAEGFSVFKLKVGSRNIPLDVQKVEVLREVIGFQGTIRLDANNGWSLDEAVGFATGTGKAQIEFIEDPCKDENDHEKFFRRTDIPWAIDLHPQRQTLEACEGAQGLKAVVIKPMLYGGVAGFLSVKETAWRMGIGVIVSSLFESSVGLEMLASLAGLTDETCGLGTADWFGGEARGMLGKGGVLLSGRS